MASPLPPPPSATVPRNPAAVPLLRELHGRRVAFTTPTNYSPRLQRTLELHGALPLPIPTVVVEPTPSTITALASYLYDKNGMTPPLESFSALAFTSRTGISAFSDALTSAPTPPLSASNGPPFTISALGKDAELLDEVFLSRLCGAGRSRVRVMVPEVASPAGMVEELGDGEGKKKVLCPVPIVVDLEEPPVVPDFIRLLESKNWVAVRVPAYETRWAGPGCAEGLVGLDEGELDALVFTSTAEVEGFLKGLEEVRWNWEMVRMKWPRMIVAAHGPVTADGAERLGVRMDVVGEKFGSFDGVLEALASKWRSA